MKKEILKFFRIQRQIFGVCPHSNEFFRLSDCKISLKGKPKLDWLDKLKSEDDKIYKLEEKIDRLEEKIYEIEDELREIARQKGRRTANRAAKRIDPIFTPRKLNPDDAKIIFHPVDFLIFNGMKNNVNMKNLLFLDRELKSKEDKKIQRSIDKTIEKENYEWVTLRIAENGSIKEE